MIQKFLAHLLSGILRNPAEVQLIKGVVDADPAVPAVVKEDLDVALALAEIYAAKKPGTLVYKLDVDGSEQTIAHVSP